MTGEFAAGDRMQEKALADRLDTSRTPVRLALTELAKEGLLEYKPNKGFVVRGFSPEHILNAIDVREVLEGMAARMAATIGLSEQSQKKLRASLLQIDGLLAKEEFEYADAKMYAEINGDFHSTIVEAAQNEVLVEMVEKFDAIPLAGSKSFALVTTKDLAAIHQLMERNQQQHHWVYNAIVDQDPARAETIFRQHIHEARDVLGRVMKDLRQSKINTSDFPLLRLVG